MNRRVLLTAALAWALLQLGPDVLAQFKVNTKIEAEDLVRSSSCISVSYGKGWVNHQSYFIYGTCGNRHWLCDYRVLFACQYVCCDEYVSVPVTIPTAGEYLVYAYVSNWSDSAGIVGNRGCGRSDKQECCGWFVAWDTLSALDKVLESGGTENVPKERLWKTYPYNRYCGRFALDTISLGSDKTDCPGGDPRECSPLPTTFTLDAGTHTLYLKVAEEYTLIDWLYIAKIGDPPPAATPGRSWQATAIDGGNAETLQPVTFSLKPNYPNPFNPTTSIEYYLPKRAAVRLTVYDLAGRPLSVLVNAVQEPGSHAVRFDGSGLSSGTYLYRLEALCETCGGQKTFYKDEKKMTLLK
jgi:hypothetical protein